MENLHRQKLYEGKINIITSRNWEKNYPEKNHFGGAKLHHSGMWMPKINSVAGKKVQILTKKEVLLLKNRDFHWQNAKK